MSSKLNPTRLITFSAFKRSSVILIALPETSHYFANTEMLI